MLDKHYKHADIEKHWYQQWEDQQLFRVEKPNDKPNYVIVIPPPNVTGKLHMGHILNNTVQDILIRWKRMSGYNALWVPGTDHAGIATQNMVEKHLRSEGVDPDSLPKEDFLKRVWQWKDDYGGIIIQQLKKMGAGCDWSRLYFTMDEGLSQAVRVVFKKLYDKGLIYRGQYIVNWCPTLQTALSDDEVERSEEPSHLWHFRYPLVGGDETLIVATTRPETMLGDTGVAVHPDDERFRHLVGRKVRLPIVGREIPIFADRHVDPEFGTGCVKITPAHDPNDFEMGKTHDLEFIVVMDKVARMNENVPEAYRGMDRYECRKAVVAEMERLGCLEKVEDHTVAVGRCYRTNDVIEPYLSEQWFIKMTEMAERALKPVADGTIEIQPERWVKTYNHWLTNIRDWCISRQLIWGHQIPVWYCNACGKEMCETVDPSSCIHCGSDQLRQDPDVLDTWASSWLLPFTVFGWPDQTKDLASFYPTQTLVTGPDILFFWVARMIMAGQEFTGQVPFTKVYLNGIVRDMKGRKMSKTLGNSPDPLDIIDQYGADALRFSIVYSTPFGQDTRFAAESCELGRGFCTKIWNATRFLQMSFEDVAADSQWHKAHRDVVARWILSRLATTVQAVSEDLEQFRVASAASRIYNFFWGEYCDWYVEFLKPAIAAADESEKAVLKGRTLHVGESCLRLLHPFMPFITEELWHTLETSNPKQFLLQQEWPQVEESWLDPDVELAMNLLQQLITGVRAARKSYQIPNKARFRLYLYADERQRQMVGEVEPILMKLAGLERYQFLEEDGAPQGCTAITLKGMGAYLDLRGHLDIDAELAKMDGKLAKLEKEFRSISGRLDNPKFVNKAPQPVVQKVREEHQALKIQIESLTQTKRDLEKLR